MSCNHDDETTCNWKTFQDALPPCASRLFKRSLSNSKLKKVTASHQSSPSSLQYQDEDRLIIFHFSVHYYKLILEICEQPSFCFSLMDHLVPISFFKILLVSCCFSVYISVNRRRFLCTDDYCYLFYYCRLLKPVFLF